jgi:hypothetical protein
MKTINVPSLPASQAPGSKLSQRPRGFSRPLPRQLDYCPTRFPDPGKPYGVRRDLLQ